MSAVAPVTPSKPTTPSVLKASAAEFHPSSSSSSNYTDSPQLLNAWQHNDPPSQPQYPPFGGPFGGYPGAMMHPPHLPGHYFDQPRPGYHTSLPTVYYEPQPLIAPWPAAQNGFYPSPNGYTPHGHVGYVHPNGPFAHQMRHVQDVRNGSVINTFNNNVFGGTGQWKRKGKKNKKNRKNKNQQKVLENGDDKGEEQGDGVDGVEHNDEVDGVDGVKQNGKCNGQCNGEDKVKCTCEDKRRCTSEDKAMCNGEARQNGKQNGEHNGEEKAKCNGKNKIKCDGQVEQNGKQNGENKVKCNGEVEQNCKQNGKQNGKCNGSCNCCPDIEFVERTEPQA
jgi:hypothetical protein